jgi:hypothetical protein
MAAVQQFPELAFKCQLLKKSRLTILRVPTQHNAVLVLPTTTQEESCSISISVRG